MIPIVADDIRPVQQPRTRPVRPTVRRSSPNTTGVATYRPSRTALQPTIVANHHGALRRHRRLHREPLQPDPPRERPELPDPDRIEDTTLNPHPTGRIVITAVHRMGSSPACPPDGERRPTRPRKDSNLRTRFRKPMLYPLSYGGSCHLNWYFVHVLAEEPPTIPLLDSYGTTRCVGTRGTLTERRSRAWHWRVYVGQNTVTGATARSRRRFRTHTEIGGDGSFDYQWRCSLDTRPVAAPPRFASAGRCWDIFGGSGRLLCLSWTDRIWTVFAPGCAVVPTAVLATTTCSCGFLAGRHTQSPTGWTLSSPRRCSCRTDLTSHRIRKDRFSAGRLLPSR